MIDILVMLALAIGFMIGVVAGGREGHRPPCRSPGPPRIDGVNVNPPADSNVRPAVPPKAPPPRMVYQGHKPSHDCLRCLDRLEELTRVERFNDECG